RRLDARHARRTESVADAARARHPAAARGARRAGLRPARAGRRDGARPRAGAHGVRGPGGRRAPARAGARRVNALEAVAAALGELGDPLAVSSLGTATSALRAASDDGP